MLNLQKRAVIFELGFTYYMRQVQTLHMMRKFPAVARIKYHQVWQLHLRHLHGQGSLNEPQ